MDNTMDINQISQLKGSKVLDKNGEVIGTLVNVWVDQHEKPVWYSIASGMFGLNANFAPTQGSKINEEGIWVDYTKEKVHGSHAIDMDGDLTDAEAMQLYEYYGMSMNTTGGSTSGSVQMTEPRSHQATNTTQTDDDNDDHGMTLSEEEVEVHKERHETGRVRLKKYIVTEDVTMTVPVKKEKVKIVREPAEGMDGKDIELGEGTTDITLSEEEVHLEKRVVPKERVRLEKEEYTEEEKVTGQVRKERAKLEGEDEEQV